METIIFAGISLILLIPVVYVLPLSLTFKGKLVIIGGAVAVSMAGLVMANIYPLWQTLIFLSLLLFLALFLIGRKIEPLMLSTQAEADSDFYNPINEKSFLKGSEDERVSLVNMDEDEKLVYETSEHHVAASEEYVQEMEDEKSSEVNEVIVLDDEFLETRTDNLVETESIPEIEVPEKSNISELEKLLEDDTVEPLKEETADNPEMEVSQSNDISELEKLLEDDTIEPLKEEATSNLEIEITVKSDISEIEKLLEDDLIEPSISEDISEIEVPVKKELSDIERLLEGDFPELMNEEAETNLKMEISEEIDISEIEKLLEDEYVEHDVEEKQLTSQSGPAKEDNLVHLKDTDEKVLSMEIEELDVLPEEHTWETGIMKPELEADSIDADTVEEKLDFDRLLTSSDAGKESGIIEDLADETDREDILEFDVEEQDSDDIEVEDTLEMSAGKEEQEPTLESSPIMAEIEETSPETSVSGGEQELPIAEEPATAPESDSELQQQMFQMMVSQIEIAKHQLNDSEFEQLVMSHLHPDLPDQQYYIFASLLIQKYITAKKTDKLREWIAQLKERFSAHRILLQELEFMESRFC